MILFRKLLSAFMIAILIGLAPAQPVMAIPQEDVDSVYRDSVHYALPPPAVCGVEASEASVTPLVGSNNAEKTYNFLRSKGLSPQQAAGIMGNLQVESGFIPNNQQNGSPWPQDGWGIAQWTDARRATLRDAVIKAGLPYTNDDDPKEGKLSAGDNEKLLSFQLNFMYNEANSRKMRDNPNVSEWEGLKKVGSVRDAVIFWEYNFERAGKPALGSRLAAANSLLTRFGSGLAAGSSACGIEGGGAIVGGYSLPVDQKWYKSNKIWFTKPHHDYPSSDIPVPTGTKVYSMTAGKVTRAPIYRSDTSYGQGVIITASDGTQFIYGHGTDGGSISGAKEGDIVKAGQLIMHSGNTGNSNGAHLHLEIRTKSGTRVCPQKLFVAIGENSSSVPSIGSLSKSGCTY